MVHGRICGGMIWHGVTAVALQWFLTRDCSESENVLLMSNQVHTLKARCVETSKRKRLTGWLHVLLGATVALLTSPGLTAPALAISISIFTSGDSNEHARYCHCGSHCNLGSCCCGLLGTKARWSSPPPSSGMTDPGSSPCMSSAPCQESGLPGSPRSVEPSGKFAAMALSRHDLAAAWGSLLPLPSRCKIPARRTSRLDDPPENPTAA